VIELYGAKIKKKVYASIKELGFHRVKIHFPMPRERYRVTKLFVESHRGLSPLESTILKLDVEAQEEQIRRLEEIARIRGRKRTRSERRNNDDFF